jgi:hypothetical protein
MVIGLYYIILYNIIYTHVSCINQNKHSQHILMIHA